MDIKITLTQDEKIEANEIEQQRPRRTDWEEGCGGGTQAYVVFRFFSSNGYKKD